MKPLYKISESSKQVNFNLILSGLMNDMGERANEWFKLMYLDTDYCMFGSPILTSNLRDDLAYMFTTAIWWIDVAKAVNITIDNATDIEYMYNQFVDNADGHKYMVNERRYNIHENRLYTNKELKENDNKLLDLLNSIDLD